MELRGKRVHTATVTTIPMAGDGAVVIITSGRNPKPKVWDTLREARLFARQLVWENRPSKVAFFAVRSRRTVRYGIRVLLAPQEES